MVTLRDVAGKAHRSVHGQGVVVAPDLLCMRLGTDETIRDALPKGKGGREGAGWTVVVPLTSPSHHHGRQRR
jgi:hypothetical protein